MSVLLPFLRPLAAVPFIIDGLDAVVNSDEHAQRAQGLLEYAGSYGLTTPPVALVEKAATATGALSVVAGTALSLSIAPATSAYTLAALNVPVTLINSTYFNGRQLVVALTPALRGAALSAGLLALGVAAGQRRKLKRVAANDDGAAGQGCNGKAHGSHPGHAHCHKHNHGQPGQCRKHGKQPHGHGHGPQGHGHGLGRCCRRRRKEQG